MTSAWQIYASFVKIGALLFGGGYAMLPLLEREVVGRRAWCKQEEMLDYYAMAQLVPGVIAINTAMLVGQKLRGWTGVFAAMLGVVSAPFLVILGYAIALDAIREATWARDALAGLRPAAAGMLLGTAWSMVAKNIKLPFPSLVALAVFILVFLLDVDAVTVICIGIACGLIWWAVEAIRRGHGKERR